jgi:peptidyl-tRNA hydrolase
VRRGDLPADLVPYVLADFAPDEVLLVQEAVGLAAEAVACFLEEGPVAAMNRFNARRP